MFVFPDIGTGGALQPNLASIVGYIPAGYNMLPTTGFKHGFQTDWTDFGNADSGYWSLNGSEATQPTSAQLTLVTGLSGPDHSANATKLVETTFNGVHAAISFNTALGASAPPLWNTFDAPIPIRIAAIARANERTRCVLSFADGNVAAAYRISIGFDLAGMNVGYDNSVGANLTLLGTHISDLGGGWRLYYFDHFVSSGGLSHDTVSNNMYQPAIYLDNGSGTAARSISYVGDVTKGLEVLWFSMLPVAMWNMSTLAFQDDFTSLSTIDLTNSKAPGFKWYINNAFPNSGPNGPTNGVADWGNFWNGAGVNIPSLPGDLSIVSPSVLQIAEPVVSASPGFTSQMFSVVSTSNTPGTVPGYIGTALPAPLFIEWSWVTDTSFDNFNPFWQGDGPILWGSTIPTLTQVGFAADGKAHMMEWDIIGGGNRVRGPAIGSNVHDWFDPPTDTNATFGGLNQGSFTTSGNDPDNPQMLFKNGFRKAGGLWVNCAYNNYTWGFFLAFADGQWRGQVVSYSPASILEFGVTGFISLVDGHRIPIFITTPGSNGASAPAGQKAQIDWVRAWTVASPPTVYAFYNAFDMGTIGAAGLTPTLSQNGYQVTKPGTDASWTSARAHICIGYNKIGLPFSGGVGTGKWYWEHTLTSVSGSVANIVLGIGNTAALINTFPGGSAKGAGLQNGQAANAHINGVTGLSSATITFASNDVIGFAFDADAGHVYVHRNGTYISGNPGSGNGVWSVPGDTWWPMVAIHNGLGFDGSADTISTNFGQAAFAFSVPSGYNAGVF